MATGMPFPEAAPYVWDVGHPPPPQDTIRLWTEVGNGIDKSQTGAFVLVFVLAAVITAFSWLRFI